MKKVNLSLDGEGRVSFAGRIIFERYREFQNGRLKRERTIGKTKDYPSCCEAYLEGQGTFLCPCGRHLLLALVMEDPKLETKSILIRVVEIPFGWK